MPTQQTSERSPRPELSLAQLRRDLLGLDRRDPASLRIRMVDGRPDGFDRGDLAFDREARRLGLDWPTSALTMVGERRLDHLAARVEQVMRDGVRGDLLEAGVWRGGCTIWMRALLAYHADVERSVWVADSFQGLPAPDAERFPADAGLDLRSFHELAVPQAEVEANFRRYGLLDERVRFVPGWFEESLASCEVERLALLRVDCDLYSSTMAVLDALHPRVSPGGSIQIDDFGVPACAAAVLDFRERWGIRAPLTRIDWTGVEWIA